MAFTPASRARLQATLAATGALGIWWWRGGLIPPILFSVLAVLAVVAWMAPLKYAPIQRGLDRIVNGLLAALTWLLLGVVYFGLFTPWRLWRAVARKDPLDRRYDSRAATYLRAVPPGATGRFDRQF